MTFRTGILVVLALITSPLSAQDMTAFTTGPVFEEYGPNAPVETDFEIPEGAEFKVAFDVTAGAETGELNRTLESAARFINMHGEGGIDPRPLDIVLVIHGSASGDLVDEDQNAQRDMVEALLEQGVRIVLCGQSMVALGIPQDSLIDGVEVALSAMTAHASLMGKGYNSMPF